MDNCPTLSVNIYKYGIKIAEDRLASASDADKAAAADLVMRVYNQRLEHYPEDKAEEVIKVIAYWNRLYGYALLLVTDEYPSFSLN